MEGWRDGGTETMYENEKKETRKQTEEATRAELSIENCEHI